MADILEYLAAGMTEAAILADVPDLGPEQLRAVLAFAAARERLLVDLTELAMPAGHPGA